MAIKARYVGSGGFHDGIPARDLTDEEFAALGPEQQRLVAESTLYRVQREGEPKKDKEA